MTPTAGVLVCVAIFGTWFVLTVICQFTGLRLVRLIRGHDYFGVIPTWTFFAPNPAVQDFTLVFRDQDAARRFGEWKVLTYSPPSKAVRWIWNPDKRRSKVVHDMATVWLMVAEADASSRAFLLSVPYLCLLHQVVVAPHAPSAVAVQIAVASVHGRQPLKAAEILATSPVHEL